MGITIIGFIGSVFSPNYFMARQGSTAPNPIDHSAFNTAIYGGLKSRWAFTEEPRNRVQRSADFLQIGNNRLSTETPGEVLIEIDDRTPCFRLPIRGTVRLRYNQLFSTVFFLDQNRRHCWHPIAPRATVEVALESPSLHFAGSGYMDMNFGEVSLESDFVRWCWSRHIQTEQTVVFYDGVYADGNNFAIAASFHDSGDMTELASTPDMIRLPDTRLWKCPGWIRSERKPRFVSTLENSPFYARSVVETTLEGISCMAMHESLHLDQFVTPRVQQMLPFRLRRNS